MACKIRGLSFFGLLFTLSGISSRVSVSVSEISDNFLPNYLTPDDFERARISELNGFIVHSNRSLEECTRDDVNYRSEGEGDIHRRQTRSIPDGDDSNTLTGNDISSDDIIKSPDEVQYERKISTWRSKMWPNGRVPYTLNATLNAEQRAEVVKAFADYHLKTCIRFEPKQPSDTDYVDIQVDDSVCGQAEICRDGGKQYAKFGGACKGADTMIHELGHTLCLNHEHGRGDRAEYIDVSTSRLKCILSTHGVVEGHHDWLTDDLFYDYLSAYHYSVLCEHNCVVPKISGVTNCGSDRLSVLDVEKVNGLYECPGCLSYRFRPISKLFKTIGDDVSVTDYILWYTTFFGEGKGKEREALVEGGRSADGKTLYPCRAYHHGDIVPGRGSLLSRSCQITYNGEAFEKTKNFEVLTNPKNAGLKWIGKPEDGSLPSNAIPGGRTRDRDTLYMGRCTVRDAQGREALVPGKFHKNKNLLTVSNLTVANGGREVECSSFEILVCD